MGNELDKSMCQKKVQLIKESINKVIIGKSDTIDMLLTAVISKGHVLLEDVPGTGKTVMAKTFAKSINAEFQRIQFTPDLLPSDVTGINYYNQKLGEFTFRKGPVFGNIILADEINRATPRTQSSLLECMEEHQITIDGETRILDEPFLVIATQNPIETSGTFQLPEAQLDRFIMKLNMGYPDKAEEISIIDRFLLESPFDTITPVCEKEDIINMQAEAKNIYIHSALKEYIVDVVNATRNLKNVSIGVSPRGTLTMINAARSYAYIQGRSYVVPEDIKKLAVPVFAHRLVLKLGMTREDNRDLFIEQALESVPVPTEEWS